MRIITLGSPLWGLRLTLYSNSFLLWDLSLFFHCGTSLSSFFFLVLAYFLFSHVARAISQFSRVFFRFSPMLLMHNLFGYFRCMCVVSRVRVFNIVFYKLYIATIIYLLRCIYFGLCFVGQVCLTIIILLLRA